MDELWDDYLNYLIWRGGLQKMTKYSKLFEILHNIDFAWVLERDDNRESDGVDLREYYTIPDGFSMEIVFSFYAKKCSVLEMLIALSIRVDDEFIGDPVDEHPEYFFMTMIKNLGLDVFVNGNYMENDVLKIINKWMYRKFNKNGKGSPFPVRRDTRDQRHREIWDQMNTYISENYV